MTTLFKRDINGDYYTTPIGEEDEVDIHFLRDENGDVKARTTPLSMTIPAKGKVLSTVQVFDAETGTNVDGTFINALEESYEEGKKWGENGTEFTGTFEGGGGGSWIQPNTPTLSCALVGTTYTITITNSTVGATNTVYYSYGSAFTACTPITGNGTVTGIPKTTNGLFMAYVKSVVEVA